MKPKASDALCILPVEKCDFNFYVVHGEGWEQGISQDIYVLPYLLEAVFTPFLSVREIAQILRVTVLKFNAEAQ